MTKKSHDDLRERWPLSNKPNERVRHTLPRRELMEDRTGGNPDKLFPIFGLLLEGVANSLVASEVVVPFLYGHRFFKFIIF